MAKGRGNGSGSVVDIPFDGGNVSDLERIIGHNEMPNVIKTFVNPGDTCRALLMRTVFRDENERNHVLRYLRKLEEYSLEDYIEQLINWLAGSCSVGGRSRKEVLQGVTGFIVPGLYSDVRGMDVRRNNRGRDEDRQ